MISPSTFNYGAARSSYEHAASMAAVFSSEGVQEQHPMFSFQDCPYVIAHVAKRGNTQAITDTLTQSEMETFSAVGRYLYAWMLHALPHDVDLRVSYGGNNVDEENCRAYAMQGSGIVNPPREFQEIHNEFSLGYLYDRSNFFQMCSFDPQESQSLTKTYEPSGVLPSEAFAWMFDKSVQDRRIPGFNYFGAMATNFPILFLNEFFRRADQSGYRVNRTRREYSAQGQCAMEAYYFTALGLGWLDIVVYIDIVALKRMSLLAWVYQKLRDNPTVVF